MSLPTQIAELLKVEPGLTSSAITEKLNKDPRTVKVILWKMHKTGKIARQKQPRVEKKKGPANEYAYTVAA
jgi:predicted transcriptional regulator